MLLGRRVLGDYREGTSREWIATNGLGGYSSSTAILANTRKYHGLLIAPLKPPWERRHFLAKLEEETFIDGQSKLLSVNKYPGTIYPSGHDFMDEFRLEPLPTFVYDFGWRLEKTIHMVHGHNAVVVSYRVLEGGPGVMRLYPLVNSRSIHGLTKMENRRGGLSVEAWEKGFKVNFGDNTNIIVASDSMRFKASELPEDAKWYRNMEYEEEAKRGYEYSEDHYSPGFFELKADAGARFNILASAGYGAEKSFDELYSTDPSRYDELRKEEEERLESVEKRLPSELKQLVRASDSFLVKMNSGMGVIAGYHWFSTWGRDALVSLPGLCMVTLRFDDAKNVLRSYASYLRDGVIPNFVVRDGASYNSVDASLWFVYALHKYLSYTDDLKFCGEMWPVVVEIVARYSIGASLGEGCTVSMATDGLLETSGGESQVTWMDARVGGRAITPRTGKPVEVNALWYNALRAADSMAARLGKRPKAYAKMAANAKEGFKVFWNKDTGCLFDVLTQGGGDASVRPNQLFAVSLPYSGLLGSKAEEMIITKIGEELVTPHGIRSLSPWDGRYIGVCEGDQSRRDSAYHMGTSWGWLMGQYVTGFLKTQGYSQSALNKSKALLDPLIDAHTNEAGLGTISEIFDGDPPHQPRGCVSQAWSVAELLRCYVEDVVGKRPIHEGKWLI